MPSASSVVLRHLGYVDLSQHEASGGFDHAAVHAASGNVYVAHTANNAVDVLDPSCRSYLFSVRHLPGVAGVLVSDEAQIIITANRGENTIGIFSPAPEPKVSKIAVGVRPNVLAYDHARRQILVANVGDPTLPGSHTLTIVGLLERAVRAEIPVAGRTRWTVYDPDAQAFYVNLADPSEIVVVDARQPNRIARTFAIPSAGPHGLDLDLTTHRLFCACDSGMLITLDAQSGKVLGQDPLSGAPDVCFSIACTDASTSPLATPASSTYSIRKQWRSSRVSQPKRERTLSRSPLPATRSTRFHPRSTGRQSIRPFTSEHCANLRPTA